MKVRTEIEIREFEGREIKIERRDINGIHLAWIKCKHCDNYVPAGAWEDFFEFHRGECEKCGSREWEELPFVFKCRKCGHEFQEPTIIDEIAGNACPKCLAQDFTEKFLIESDELGK